MKKDSVVLYPFYGISHLAPMVELAKLLSRHGFAATVLLPYCPAPSYDVNVDSFLALFAAHHPSISIHRLPPVSSSCNSDADITSIIFDSIKLNNPNILSFLRGHSETHCVRAMFMGFLCTDALDVASELGIPSYFLISCAAGDLSVFLYLPTLVSASEFSFKDMDGALLDFPGLPRIPAPHLPDQIMDRESVPCKLMLHRFQRLAEADGLLINSFEELENRVVEALRDGSCVPGRRMPTVHCLGPLIAEKYGSRDTHECIAWLDSQPPRSVVFLCFGTLGAFSVEQVKEIAAGLERSGQRFLWVVRAPIAKGAPHVKLFEEPQEPDTDELMPEGFLNRTRGRGMVVKSWAPQREVLGHESVGGFVTHCGWNSILESIVNGVPMIAWPLYAEQRLNKLLMAEVVNLAVVIDGYDKGMVTAEEVEKKVRWLMESDGGEELRRQAATMKKAAAQVSVEGGSSYGALLKLVAALKGTSS